MPICVGAIGVDVMTGYAGARPVTGQARICKQVFSYSELQRVSGGRQRYRSNRLLFGGRLWTEGLRPGAAAVAIVSTNNSAKHLLPHERRKYKPTAPRHIAVRSAS